LPFQFLGGFLKAGNKKTQPLPGFKMLLII